MFRVLGDVGGVRVQGLGYMWDAESSQVLLLDEAISGLDVATRKLVEAHFGAGFAGF